MKSRIITVILAMICVALITVIIFERSTVDHNPPEIRFASEELTYTQGDSKDELLGDVTATDPEDGDVSDSLIISSMSLINDNTGTVTYAARDSANNITTVSRRFYYEQVVQKDDTKIDGAVSDDKEEVQGVTTAVTEELNDEDAQYAVIKEEQLNAGKPYLRLTEHEISLSKGSLFSIYRYIQELSDDKDKDLSKNVYINGLYDVTTAGVYDIQVYAYDSDGNMSNIEDLTLIIIK